MISLVILVIIGLAVGLGVGLSHHKHSKYSGGCRCRHPLTFSFSFREEQLHLPLGISLTFLLFGSLTFSKIVLVDPPAVYNGVDNIVTVYISGLKKTNETSLDVYLPGSSKSEAADIISVY